MNKVPKEVVEKYILVWLDENELAQLRLVDQYLNRCVQGSHIWQKIQEWDEINDQANKALTKWFSRESADADEPCPCLPRVELNEKIQYARQQGWWALHSIYLDKLLKSIQVYPTNWSMIGDGTGYLAYST